jgi:hypothetical protein
MKRAVFADAAYYFALLNERDQYAQRAVEFTGSFRGRFITTTAVLTEVGNSLSRGGLRTAFPTFVSSLRRSRRVENVPESPELWDEALQLYADRPDKTWSFTDCISFVVMRERDITEAATADHHFEQAGFTILLK